MANAREGRAPGSRPAYLEALGIDVWVRREARAPAAMDAPQSAVEPAEFHAPGPHSVPEAPTPDSGETAPAATDEASAVVEEAGSFTIRGLRLGQVVALVDDPLWGHRRFFLDVANAMNGWRSDGREELRFEWPQLPASDSGMAAAGRAFRAFVEAQSGGGARILAVGPRVAQLIGAHFEGRCLHVARTADTRSAFDGAVLDAAEKRDLWKRIVHAS